MRYVIELYLPSGAQRRAHQQAEELRRAAARLEAQDRQIRYVHTLVLPEDESCLHLVDASDEDAVAAAAQLAGIDSPRIRAALELDLGATGATDQRPRRRRSR